MSHALAFVSHEACARHDTGWNHPDHQGRLRAIVQAVYADLPALHPHLLEVPGDAASVETLARVHEPAYLETLRRASEEAAAAGSPRHLDGNPDFVVSGATWEALRGASGSVGTAVRTVMEGRAARAFACVRPPGRAAGRSRPGGYGFVNHAAVAAAELVEAEDRSVLYVDWGIGEPPAAEAIFAAQPRVRVVHRDPLGGADPAGFPGRLAEGLDEATRGFTPDVVLLSAGFDSLAADPTTDAPFAPGDIAEWTRPVRAVADRVSGGRLVSVLEGGFDAKATGEAVVAHLRVLAGVEEPE